MGERPTFVPWDGTQGPYTRLLLWDSLLLEQHLGEG